jgi:predicted nuclease of predicted toxin-antitoxin system
MKLLLDEHFSPETARQLRLPGHDVVAVRELPDLHGLTDEELLAWATAQRRALVTENVADFVELHRRSILRRRPHAGIVFTSPKRFPRTRRAIGRLVRALEELLVAHSDRDGLAGEAWWL